MTHTHTHTHHLVCCCSVPNHTDELRPVEQASSCLWVSAVSDNMSWHVEVLGVHPASLLRCGKHRVTVSEERFYKGKREQPKNLGLLEVNVEWFYSCLKIRWSWCFNLNLLHLDFYREFGCVKPCFQRTHKLKINLLLIEKNLFVKLNYELVTDLHHAIDLSLLWSRGCGKYFHCYQQNINQ